MTAGENSARLFLKTQKRKKDGSGSRLIRIPEHRRTYRRNAYGRVVLSISGAAHIGGLVMWNFVGLEPMITGLHDERQTQDRYERREITQPDPVYPRLAERVRDELVCMEQKTVGKSRYRCSDRWHQRDLLFLFAARESGLGRHRTDQKEPSGALREGGGPLTYAN